MGRGRVGSCELSDSSRLAAAALALTSAGPASAGGDKDCGDFDSRAEAQRFFKKNGGPKRHPHRLDRDGDGKACEEYDY